MERILQQDEFVMQVRIFQLNNDLNLKPGDNIPLIKPDNEYRCVKQGDLDEAIGVVKVNSYRRLGVHSELIGDIYLNTPDLAKKVFSSLTDAKFSIRSGISDNLHLCAIADEFRFTLKDTVSCPNQKTTTKPQKTSNAI